MIRSFKRRALSSFWHKSDFSGVRPDLVPRLQSRLTALNTAKTQDALNVPGFDLHKLHGKPTRYAIKVNGPWRVTFEWDGEDAVRVDLEQYH